MKVLLFDQPYQARRDRPSHRQNLAVCPQCGQSQTDAAGGCFICAYQAQASSPEYQPTDRLIAIIIAQTLSLLTALIFSILPAGFDLLLWSAIGLMAFAAAIGIAEAVLRGIQDRRFQALGPMVVGCFVLAVCFVSPILLLTQGLSGLITPGCLLVIGAPTILVWLR